jgi:hypothetical protein
LVPVETRRPILQGSPWGRIYPRRESPRRAIQPVDGRTWGLRALRDYLCALEFYCPGPDNTVTPFRIRPENFWLEQPENLPGGMKFPSVSIQGSRGDYQAVGFVTFLQEETRDRFAPGTVVQWQSEYAERINVEVWASEEPELRALLAGLETAMNPVEELAGVRLFLDQYYGQPCHFLLTRRENYSDADAAKGRRHAQLEMTMTANVVRLVRYAPFRPQVSVGTNFDADTGLAFDLAYPTTIPVTQKGAPLPVQPNTAYAYPADASDAPGPSRGLGANWPPVFRRLVPPWLSR